MNECDHVPGHAEAEASASSRQGLFPGFALDIPKELANYYVGAQHAVPVFGSRASGMPYPYQVVRASSNSLASCSSPAGRGDSFVTRCWGRVPSTSAAMCELLYPSALSPFGTFNRCM